MVNISHHSDVPKHEIMTSEEAGVAERIEAEDARSTSIIFKTDPMAIHRARSGDVVRIHRKSLTAGETLFYRFCV
jgi:DNA-directed RNA polymerase subunit H